MEHSPRTATRKPPHKLERIGKYRIVRPLSKGGMALVYEARRESKAGVSPRVAIKLILPEYANSDTFQDLFINEARLGAAMQHQNLVQIQDFDREGDSFFIVMEYVEGVTLRRAISLCERNDILIPPIVISEIGRQACDGLHYAHTAKDERGTPLGLVHRDIKPSNVILNPQGVPKILDFGISKGNLMAERRGAVKGTWGYMAPEQAMGQEVGPAADVFGLGTVLYELAARRPLFKNKKPAEIKRLLMDDHAARLAATLDPSYGPLVNVLVRALQRDPAARFASAAEFGRALSALLPDPVTARDEVSRFYQVVSALNEGLPVPSHPLTGSHHTTSATHGSMAPTATTDPGSPWLVVFGVAAAALLGVVLVGGGVMMYRLGLGGSSGSDVVQVAPGTDTPDPVEAPARVTEAPSASTDSEGASTGQADPPKQAAATDPPRQADPVEAPRTEPVRRPPADTVPAPSGADASEGDRPVRAAPDQEPEPAPDEPVKIVVVRPAQGTTEPEPEPAQEAVDETPAATGPGTLTISSVQPAEVYVDGKFIRKIPLVRREFPSGRHIVTIVALDGRRKSFDVDLEAGQEVRRVWDFDRAEWRH